jgi:hypothetical protein
VRGLGGFAVVKVSTLEGFQQGSMGGFRWGIDEGLQLKPRATRCVENRKLLAEGVIKASGGIPHRLWVWGRRGRREGFGGFQRVLEGSVLYCQTSARARDTSSAADAEVATTVRTRLAQLKQTSSVAHYHASFRAIMVEAVTAPVTGPEACSYFRAGLKPKILDRINLDTTIRHEVFNLDVIVRAAKEAEAYL